MTTSLASVCVFCGSTPGNDERYLDAAREMGALLARRGITMVYGGARAGLMGAAADAALDDGGRVVGVMPRGLWTREIGHTGLTELLVVESMHERKALMASRADDDPARLLARMATYEAPAGTRWMTAEEV